MVSPYDNTLMDVRVEMVSPYDILMDVRELKWSVLTVIY